MRGLGDKLKRREMFNWLRRKSYSIYMLQEVHCSENKIPVWSAEWGYKTLFSCCTSAKGGVAILFNNNFDLQVLRSYLDPNGRFIICDITANKKCMTIATLYAPNDDDPNFFLDFFDHLNDFQCDEIAIGGDFNLVLELYMDKKGGLAKTHTESVKTLKDFCAQFDLLDVWRILNPDTRRYTWQRKRPEIQCRLDFFLITESLMCNIKSANISTGYKTDHSLIEIKIATHSNMRGPGFWKLNTSLLTEIDFVNQIRAVIKNTQEEYKNDSSVDDALMWEMIKLKIREHSLKYSAVKKAKTSRDEEELEKEINSMQRLIESSNLEEKDKKGILDALDTKRLELEKIIEYRTKGSILRARCRWHNEGEKNTKYFLNLEKRHYKQGVISQLKLGNENFVTTDKEILSECETFYKCLYSSNNGNESEYINDVFFGSQTEKRLNLTEQESCEGLLTRTECLNALNNMECNKTPGSDGLPAEFYKVFWNDIAEFFLKSINQGYRTGQLSVTQRRGIIKLIPKKEAEPYLIKNWRPISLLNCDYKIAAKAIANRFKHVLPNLINSDQTGFLKGRFIGENIRLIDGIIKYAAAKNIPGLLLFLDFEKAFDTVEWPFLQKTLQHYNFGPSAMNWIRLFYHNTESCILNNGWSGSFFKLERGVRQGCPLSPYLFILCVEILAEAIRKNESIKGITINEQEIKISQYADDTTLILDGSTVSFTTSLQILDLFSEISGLRLNIKKTEALWIGSKIGKEVNLSPEKNFKWVKDKVKALGVWLSTNPETTIEANYSEKLTKVRNSLSCWELRRLSLLGKITVLKSLIASQLVYILSPLPTNHNAIKEINNIFFNFLWDGKGDKVKRDIIISDYENGGLRMIDIKVFNQALKSGWIKKYLDRENHGKWKLLFDLELKNFGGEEIFRGNLNKEDLSKYIKISETFTSEILQIWTDIKYEANISSIEQLKAQNLWQNSLIRVGNRPIHYGSWSSKGVKTVGHLIKDENSFLSFSDFTERYNVKTNFLTFHGVISAVKSLWKRNEANLHNDNGTIYETIIDTFLKTKKPNRIAYKILVSKKQKSPMDTQRKWVAECMLEDQENIDWKTVYRTPFLCTKITKLIIFQFKLLHRRLATNSFLTKIGLKDNEQCTFCQNDKETLLHLFWTCNVSTSFWHGFKQWEINRGELPNTINLSPCLILGLKPNKNKHINFVFLIARFFIWTCKMRDFSPKIENFPLFLSHYEPTKTFS